jgi:Tol biopolymer transport system component
MASLIPGYEYDIFISYRQKDNKYDCWVTEFVDNLKRELEATFKEDVSVYFDINPHDGLLETHDVNASLKEKLKCLIFIPIISRTYCDPKSFAWEYEFTAFVELATHDIYGLKVKLPGGNVASRVLPVRIYDLDRNDINLCESVLSGVLRSIDFIYKYSGVNRPLRSKEDNPHDNLNHTIYRDQINKVANAVKEIIYCLNPVSRDETDLNQININDLQDFKESIPDSSTGNLSEELGSKSLPGTGPFNKWRIIVFFSLFLLLGIPGLWVVLKNYSGQTDKLTTYSTIPVESTLMDPYGQWSYFSISPDGRTIAIGSDKGIQLRSLSDFSVKILGETERAKQIAFSPDGQSLAYEKDGSIYEISVSGAQQSNICFMGGSGSGVFWGIDNYIYFSPGFGSEGIWRISASGGNPEKITTVIDSLGENAHRNPQLLPDSKTLIFSALGPSYGSLDSKIIIQDLKSGKRKVLIDKAIYGRYLFNGSLLFANNEGYIFTIPFNLHKLKATGEPETVLSGINTSTSGGAAFLSVSETGNLIFLTRNNSPLNVMDVVDRSGKLLYNDSIPIATFERIGHGWSSLNISPSGKFIAITGRSYSGADLWLLNLGTGDIERITFDPSEDETPVWSPDENSIAYTSSMTGTTRRLLIKDLKSAGKPHLLRTWPRHIHLTSWSPDGKWLAAYDYNSTKGTNCYAISVDSDKLISLSLIQSNENNGHFSPDGRWLVFQSNESGRSEIYVVSFPKLESKRQISEEGGILPQWDRNGKFIYFMNNDYMIAQPVEFGNDYKKGKPMKLFYANALNYDISPDGQKFYLLRKNNKRPDPPLHLVINWFQELETKKRN